MDDLLKIAASYGLPGLALLAGCCYVWKVTVPNQIKHDAFIENLVKVSHERHEALNTSYRADIRETRTDFLAALKDVETKHDININKVIDAIKENKS